MRPKSYVALRIMDELLVPEDITKQTGLTASRVWYKGETRPKSSIIEKENGWELKSSLVEHRTLSDHLEHLLSVVAPVSSELYCFTSQYYSLVTCAVYFDEEAPEIYFSNEMVKRLANLNLYLDIDLYSVH